jgi:hypothetical protein
MNSAPKRRGRNHRRYYPVSSWRGSVPDGVARDHSRRLRRWGFAAGLALVLAGAACAWAVTVLTTSATPGTPPSPTTSTVVTYTPTNR